MNRNKTCHGTEVVKERTLMRTRVIFSVVFGNSRGERAKRFRILGLKDSYLFCKGGKFHLWTDLAGFIVSLVTCR